MFLATAKTAMHYGAALALCTAAKAYLIAKTWPDRGNWFNLTASLTLFFAFLGVVTWWSHNALILLLVLGFVWIQTMGIDNVDENTRLRKALKQAGILDHCRGSFNRLDRWLLDGCLSSAGQQRLKSLALGQKLPAASAAEQRPRF